jgi:hypothetical protein
MPAAIQLECLLLGEVDDGGANQARLKRSYSEVLVVDVLHDLRVYLLHAQLKEVVPGVLDYELVDCGHELGLLNQLQDLVMVYPDKIVQELDQLESVGTERCHSLVELVCELLLLVL